MYNHCFHPHPIFREITVTGNGEVDAQPDYVQIQLEVRTEGEDVSQPQQQNAAIMNRVISALLALNIPRENIQTSAYTISPKYDYIDGRQVFRGYEVQNAINVKIMDISQAGLVIDTAIQNGANQVSSIQFKIVNTDAYYQRALNLALINAIAKAKSLAETMHVPMQPIPIEIIEETQTVQPIPYKMVAMSNQEFSTPIEPGRIPITASVRVKFQY